MPNPTPREILSLKEYPEDFAVPLEAIDISVAEALVRGLVDLDVTKLLELALVWLASTGLEVAVLEGVVGEEGLGEIAVEMVVSTLDEG
jgi:hypothetical protein